MFASIFSLFWCLYTRTLTQRTESAYSLATLSTFVWPWNAVIKIIGDAHL